MSAKLDGEFRDFMHARWPAMVRLAYGLTGDQGHAEDVAQAAFARPLRLRMLSPLKPVLGPPWTVAAEAIGAQKPTSAAVAMARAKARFFPDILYAPHLIWLILHAGPRDGPCTSETIHESSQMKWQVGRLAVTFSANF
jgi:hypothetical protein